MRSWAVWVGIVGMMGWVTPSLADDGLEKKKPANISYSFSLLGGYGAGTQFEDDARNYYGAAIGGRAGLTLPRPNLYFGLSFLHFTGDSSTGPDKVYTNTLDAEFGYDFHLLKERFLIRPQLGLGVVQAVRIQSDNAGYPLVFHWAPGMLVGVRFAPLLVSAEYRRDMVPDQWPSSNTVLFGLGLTL
jgi:hypothetical protein